MSVQYNFNQNQPVTNNIQGKVKVTDLLSRLNKEKKIEKNVKEDFDIFDTIKEHLISEGLTEQEALSVMVVMDEQDRNEIIEQISGDK